MVKVYVMESCPDCVAVKQQYGNIGIPCFVKEDGAVYVPEYAAGKACNLDGTGC